MDGLNKQHTDDGAKEDKGLSWELSNEALNLKRLLMEINNTCFTVGPCVVNEKSMSTEPAMPDPVTKEEYLKATMRTLGEISDIAAQIRTKLNVL